MTRGSRPQRGDLRLPLTAVDLLIDQPIAFFSFSLVPLAWALLPLIATAVTASTGAAACGTKAFEAGRPLARNPDDPFRCCG